VISLFHLGLESLSLGVDVLALLLITYEKLLCLFGIFFLSLGRLQDFVDVTIESNHT